jgi:hypothetical protein
MAVVINPRGTSGAGKSWLVRATMAVYLREGGEAVPLRRAGRPRPIGWQLFSGARRRPLVIIGHYEATRGGTDTIPTNDGGLQEAFRLADALSASGNDVVLEGLQLSGEAQRTTALARLVRARGGALHVLCLNVPVDRCIQNVVLRRRAGRRALPAIERSVRCWQAALLVASEALRLTDADVTWLDPRAALNRCLALIGLAAEEEEAADARGRSAVLPPATMSFAAVAAPTEEVV